MNMPKLNIVVDFDEELVKLREEVKQIQNDNLVERTKFATSSLARVTPVRTGYARSRWKYSFEEDSEGNVVGNIDNDAPYIGRLNQGSSQQAPKFFIEQVLIAIGELSAPVVDYIDEKK
jgi:hypothetical protein